MTLRDLALHFQIGTFVFGRNLHGMSHEESLLPPAPAGSTLNWVVGHIVRARNQALGLMGAKPLFDDAEFVGYGASPSVDAGILDLDTLTQRFQELGSALEEAISGLTETRLNEPAPFSPTGNPAETLGTLLQTIVFHEAYHLGQTGILRRLLDKPGVLLAPGEEEHQ